MEGAVWTNKPYKDLWIDQIFAEIPTNKFKEEGSHIKHRKTNQIYTSSDFSEYVEDSNLEADIFDISANSREIRSMKSKANWRVPEELTKKLRSMSNLLHTFLTENWETRENSKNMESNFIWSPISIRTTQEGDAGEFWMRHILRFVRVHEGKYYYCDIYFTSGMQKNMIRSNYIYYKDKNRREGAYYQANGDWGYYGKNIGGNGRFLWWKQRSWNGIDTELSKLFESKTERPKLLWKWFEVISRCLQVEECQKTLQSSRYTTLSQREEPILREDSYKPDIYKRIHPFSKIYHEVNDQLNNNGLEFSFPTL